MNEADSKDTHRNLTQFEIDGKWWRMFVGPVKGNDEAEWQVCIEVTDLEMDSLEYECSAHQEFLWRRVVSSAELQR